ncbi:uncharacterized protein F5Z01DRAFT_25837 [Emericellopsis atlantica]|uniref:Uncharacterized protein n=1 Tax=Emericellopsis atlantica TaxID=2614577 RepID=A0A9P7ZXK0_9HYPO|nr:uncharacterized protein F5Z01DRAFT_25837 [Emericellopsis atlantica]KAG9259113.1 hypothetical protein F5Z01DRAFT_25837 [Emericellopsis atlantica]
MVAAKGESAQALVSRAVKSHNITVSDKEIRCLLSDPEHGHAFADWALAHLGPSNLLTANELELYHALDQSGDVDSLCAIHDLAEVRAITDDDLERAIVELKSSTEAIVQQTETMKQQKEAMARLMQRTAESETRRRDFEFSRQRRIEAERKHIAAEVEDLSQSLGYRISDLEQQGDDSGKTISQILKDLLASDDKLLRSLQKLGRELKQQDPEEDHKTDELRDICMRYIKNTVETLRTRLDRIYLDKLNERDHAGQSNVVSSTEVEALREEVESLYSEILPVAQMSVEQQHLEPTLQLMSSRGGQSLGRSASAVSYVNDCLDYLLGRTDLLCDRLEELGSHKAATASLLATAKEELSTSTEPPRRMTPEQPAASPVRPRAYTTKGGGRRRSSGVFEEPPIDTLLQTLALYIDDDTSHQEQIQSLSKALADRSAKASDVAHSTHETFEATATKYLDDLQRAVQIVEDGVFAETSFGNVKLMDPEVEESIAFLSSETQQIKSRLDQCNTKKGDGKSEKKEDMVRRWG